MLQQQGFWRFILLATMTASSAAAQTTAPPSNPAAAPTPPPAAAPPAAAAAKAPDSLAILFDSGSVAIRPSEEKTLDQASRLFRDGKPIVMVVSGATDSVGSANANLRLSELRANIVLRELVARGIPVERFQIVGKGETDPVVPAPKGTAEPRNRRVEITWR